ncbi:MAG TPA: TolC family protein [Bordetella sp.]|nr:TolC family protein [Bordetella sp.]
MPALIDLAQLNNPATRIAWSQARQAASAVGLAEAAYLPMLTANVIGGYVSTRRRLPNVLDRRVRVDASDSGMAALLSVEWLLFDFGQRAAAQRAARDLSLGANFTFNAVHQQLVYDVTRTYYEYGAARQRSRIADDSLRNSQSVQAAVAARAKNGLATSVETAQARQLVAQARLKKVAAGGLERNAYQALLSHLGLPAQSRIQVADSAATPLPTPQELPQDAVLRRALSERPDIMASIASLKAAESAVDVAKADFLPKVYLAGFVLGGNNELSIGPVSGLSNSGASRGILLGMTMPLYDGGMRRARMHDARERMHAAQATLEQLRMSAISEIIVATNLLETALQSYDAASTLVDTSALTYDAALDSYREGMGTITVATEAANALLQARSEHADAHAGALVAAASLAFALGKLDVAIPAQQVSP